MIDASEVPAVEIDVHEAHVATTVAVRGELDLLTSPQLDQALRQALTTSRPVIVDLTRCPFMDGRGMRVLLRGETLARSLGSRLLVVCPAASDAHLPFDVLEGLPLRLVEDERAAIAALNGGRPPLAAVV